MYHFQVSNDNQQILEEQVKQNKENGYELWYKNAMNNQREQQIQYDLINNNNNNMKSNINNNNNNQDNHTFNQSNNNNNNHMSLINNNQLNQMNQQKLGYNMNNNESLSLSNNIRNSIEYLNDDSQVICNRCLKPPVDYISLNCGHNFCLECMAISVLKGEGRVIQSQSQSQLQLQDNLGFENDENNPNCGIEDTIEMRCSVCGQDSQLGYQSTRAIDIFIQMVIQKYDQKQIKLANSIQEQQQNSIYHESSEQQYQEQNQQQQFNVNSQQQLNGPSLLSQQQQILQQNQPVIQQQEQTQISLMQQSQKQQQQQLQQQQQSLQLNQQNQLLTENNQFYDQNGIIIGYENSVPQSARLQQKVVDNAVTAVGGSVNVVGDKEINSIHINNNNNRTSQLQNANELYESEEDLIRYQSIEQNQFQYINNQHPSQYAQQALNLQQQQQQQLQQAITQQHALQNQSIESSKITSSKQTQPNLNLQQQQQFQQQQQLSQNKQRNRIISPNNNNNNNNDESNIPSNNLTSNSMQSCVQNNIQVNNQLQQQQNYENINNPIYQKQQQLYQQQIQQQQQLPQKSQNQSQDKIRISRLNNSHDEEDEDDRIHNQLNKEDYNIHELNNNNNINFINKKLDYTKNITNPQMYASNRLDYGNYGQDYSNKINQFNYVHSEPNTNTNNSNNINNINNINSIPISNGQNHIEKQILTQQQQQNEEMRNSEYQNQSQINHGSTPNYSMLTEKKPTQPQYSQMMPTNNLTPSNNHSNNNNNNNNNNTNFQKKTPHISKSTHVRPNDENHHTPYQTFTAKSNGYNLNAAALSQQFSYSSIQDQHNNNNNNFHKHPQQFYSNQQHIFSDFPVDINNNNNNIVVQIDQTNDQNGQCDIRSQHPQLSAFSASNIKNSIQKGYNNNLSHLSPYGDEDNSTLETHYINQNQQNIKIPYRQQSQLDNVVVVEEIDSNKNNIENNNNKQIQLDNGQIILQEQQSAYFQQQQQQQQQSNQYQFQNQKNNINNNKVQLQLVEEIKENNNSAMNSIIGQSTQLNCSEHPFNEVSLYCFTCDNQLLCIKCLQNGDHKDHDVQTVHSNFNYLLSKMSETSHEINASIEFLTMHEKRLQEKRKECLKQIKIIKDQIQENLNDVKASIVSKEQHLLQQAEQIFTAKQNEINLEIQNIQAKSSAINAVKNQFELICSENNVKKSIAAQFDENESQQHQRQQQQHLNQQNIENISQNKHYYNQQRHEEINSQTHELINNKNVGYNSQKIHNTETGQQQNYEIFESHSQGEILDVSKSLNEIEKLNLFRFYAQCKSILGELGITKNPLINERLNNTLYSVSPQQQQQQQIQNNSNNNNNYNNNNFNNNTPNLNRTNNLNETPCNRSQHVKQQQGNIQSSATQQYNQYYQQQQGQQRTQQQHQGYAQGIINHESQYASVRSQNSQFQDEEEQYILQQQQQFQQQQYNLMSSQDLSQLIDDVQRIKKETNLIDLNNYNQKNNPHMYNSADHSNHNQSQNVTYNNENNNVNQNQHHLNHQQLQQQQQQNHPSRNNQLFHDYLSQQRNQMLLEQQMNSFKNYQYGLDNQYSTQKNQQQNHNYQTEDIQNEHVYHNYSQSKPLDMLSDHKQKDQSTHSQPPTTSKQQQSSSRLNISHQPQQLQQNFNDQLVSSYIPSQTIRTQPSSSDLLKKELQKSLTKNNSYLKQAKSKWLDEDTLEQDKEYFHHNNSQGYYSQQIQKFRTLQDDQNIPDEGNYKQKQELNKHLDNIFRKNNIASSNNNNNKINTSPLATAPDYQPNSFRITNNSALSIANGYQTERIKTNNPTNKSFIHQQKEYESSKINHFNINNNNLINHNHTDISQNNQNFSQQQQTSFSTNNSKMINNNNKKMNQNNHHYLTARPVSMLNNSNISTSARLSTNYSKMYPSVSIHANNSTTTVSSKQQQQQLQGFGKFNGATNPKNILKQQSNPSTANQPTLGKESSNYNKDSLLETLRSQKELFNKKKKQHFLMDN